MRRLRYRVTREGKTVEVTNGILNIGGIEVYCLQRGFLSQLIRLENVDGR